MRLRARLHLSSAISLGSILAIASVLAWSARESRRARSAEDRAAILRQLVVERGMMRDEFLLYREPRPRAQWEAVTARLDARLREAGSVFEDAESRRLVGEMLSLAGDSGRLFGDLARVSGPLTDGAAAAAPSGSLRERLANKLILMSYELDGRASRLAALAARRSDATQRRTTILVLVLVGATVAVFAANSVLATRLVERRIERLEAGAQRIAAGDLRHRIAIRGDDELAALGRSFDEMAEKLESITVSRDVLEAEIAERLRAEEARRESEYRFEYFFENSVVGKSITDPAGGLRVNRSFASMLGYTQEELQGKAWEEVSHPADLAATKAEVEAILGGARTSARFTKRYLRRDGAVVWADVFTTLRRDAAGNPLYFMTTVLDVTERKRAEDALRESESRFRQIAESLPQLVWTCEPDGPCDYLSRRWIEFTGLPEAQQLGFGWLEQLHPDDRAPTIAAWQAAVASGGDFRVEFRVRRHDGEYRWFDTRAARLRDAEGRTVKWFGSNTDITDRRRAEEEILRLNAELEERVLQRTAQLEAANKELEAFSYSVSHDLRAPLRAVDGFSRILLDDHAAQLDAEGARLLGVVRSSTRQMGQLIDDLLAFSRVGRQEMTRTPVDMKALAELAYRGLAAGDGGVCFTVGPLPRAEGDPALLRQVFSNLISNAVKFTAPKAERVVEVEGRSEADRAVYSVRDNGVGFEMAYADKLFGVFQRLHSTAEFEGTGVGLALVKRIVHRHGGEVWAEGKVGEGATFSFSLPLAGGTT